MVLVYSMISSLTFCIPAEIIPISAAAAFDRSIVIFGLFPQRSLIFTIHDLLLSRFVTLTMVPKGSVL